jgi:hypothetical protein
MLEKENKKYGVKFYLDYFKTDSLEKAKTVAFMRAELVSAMRGYKLIDYVNDNLLQGFRINIHEYYNYLKNKTSNKFKVYFNNGLIDTHIILEAYNKYHAQVLFKEKMKDYTFLRSHCHNKVCKLIKIEVME